MRGTLPNTIRKSLLIALGAVLTLLGPASGQQAPSTSAEHESKAAPVVRTFGAEGGYRTEIRSETKGTIGQEDRRQASLLAAQAFQHVDEARQALDADDVGPHFEPPFLPAWDEPILIWRGLAASDLGRVSVRTPCS